jgi:hypothetical protein
VSRGTELQCPLLCGCAALLPCMLPEAVLQPAVAVSISTPAELSVQIIFLPSLLTPSLLRGHYWMPVPVGAR